MVPPFDRAKSNAAVTGGAGTAGWPGQKRPVLPPQILRKYPIATTISSGFWSAAAGEPAYVTPTRTAHITASMIFMGELLKTLVVSNLWRPVLLSSP